MMRDGKKLGVTFDGAGGRAPDPHRYERTAEQKAADAEAIADNFTTQHEIVQDAVSEMQAAAVARDLGAWITARKSADQALQQLAHMATTASAAAHHATDPDVRERLASAEHVQKDAEQLVARTPAAPAEMTPELSCGDALLAALPPDPPPAEWRDPDFWAAAHAVEAVCAQQMTSSDIAAFRMIVNRHKEHAIARRFRRLGVARQQQLLELLDEDKVRLPARAREVVRRAEAAKEARRNQAPALTNPAPAEVTPTVPDSEGTPAMDASEGRAPVQVVATDGAVEPRALGEAPPREALGVAIARRAPGVTYDGTGRFVVATGGRSVTATIQRVHTGAARIRRDAEDTVVVEIPRGLDESGLTAAAVEQLQALQQQSSPQHATSPGGAPLPPDVRADMEHALGADFSPVRVHQDGQAEAVGALAFTRGADVHFAAGHYDPHSPAGRQLLGHELAHTAQQAQRRVAATTQLNGEAINDDPALEQEADAKGALVASTTGRAAAPSTAASPAATGSLQAKAAPTPDGPAHAQKRVSHASADVATVAPIQRQRDENSTVGGPADAQKRTSNARADVGTAAPIQRQRDESSTAHEPLNAERYWTRYGERTLQLALHRAMAEIVFEVAAPGLSFPTSECGPFIMKSFGWRMQDTAPHHVSQLLDTPLYELIDGVRALDDHDRGPDAFEPAIVSRIVERIGLGIRRAVSRLALPYARARSRIASAAKAVRGGPVEQGLGPVQAPESQPTMGQPDPNTLGARTTIEHAVAESLCAGFVEFHPERFPAVYDTAIPGEPHPVKLALERGRGDWLTVRVVQPASASAADVANALYGTPELAHLVVGSGNRYSYVFPPGGQLAEPYDTEFRYHMADDGASRVDELLARTTQDPVLGLDDGIADRRALDSAKASGAVPAGADAASAVQRLDILHSVVDSIANAAAPLGVAPVIAPLHARVQQRRAACAADPAEATKWAAHASAQLAIVSDAKAGFDAITEQMFAMGLPAASTAAGPELVGDVTASMQGPTRELAAAFAAAVAASEQLDIGRERLAIAKERLAAYPFDMADRVLAVIRKRIASTGHHATLPMESYETERMAKLEAELTRTIGELRIAVVNGDGTAALKLTALRSQLSMLDLQSTIGSTLTAINELSGALFNSESMAPDKDRQAPIYEQIRAAMGEWMRFAADYDAFYKAGHARDPATLEMIRAQLQALRTKTDLPALVHQLALFEEDEGKRQRWINIGIMLGAALLAAASGGMASGAIGGVAGAIVGAGIESLTFTAITSTLNQDPSFGGFMAELTLNLATFGGLRAIGGGAKLLVGGKPLTLPQKLIEMSVEGVWMIASARAQELIAEVLAHGGKVTPQSAASIFGQQMAISFASRVLARVGGVFIEGVTGAEKLHEVQLALARRAEEEQLARQVLASGDGKLGEQLVKLDTDVRKAEQRALERVHEVASNPAEAAKHGIAVEPGALERVAADARGVEREVRDQEIAALMAHAEVKADHAIVEPPVYAELLAKHRAQGSTIVEGFDSAGQPHAKITPSLAGGSFGKPFTLHQRLGEPTAPEAWMARLAEGFSPDEKAKLDKMTKGKTLAEQRASFDGSIEQSREKVRAALRLEQEAAVTKAQSKVRVEGLRRAIANEGLRNDPEIRTIVDDLRKQPKDKLPILRDKLMSKLLKAEAQAAHPNADVFGGVKIYEKLPEASMADWKAKHPGQKTDGLTERDDGLYIQRGEVDMMVVERSPDGVKGKILSREEIKTGGVDTDAKARSQLNLQSDLFKDAASGTKKLRLEVGDHDIAGELDLASDAAAVKSTRGPAGKDFDKSLGVTASDLEALCKDLLKSLALGKTP